MPRPFDVCTDSTAGVDAIHTAFGNETYWRARLFEFGKDSIRLDSLTVDDDGSVHVSTTQDMGRDMLPAVMAKAIPGGLRVMREERWRRTADELHCQAVVTATGAPLHATGSAQITRWYRFPAALHRHAAGADSAARRCHREVHRLRAGG